MLFAKKIIQFAGEKSPYTPDQVIFEQATAGAYSVDILADGQYEVYVIGGGAGGCKYTGGVSSFVASGGSGAGFIGIIKISKTTYSVTVGAGGGRIINSNTTGAAGGNSNIGSLITSYGAAAHNAGAGGAGGSSPTINSVVISQSLNTTGNSGSYRSGRQVSVSGAASVYNGYGGGGNASYNNASTTNGTAGYVKIVYKGK